MREEDKQSDLTFLGERPFDDGVGTGHAIGLEQFLALNANLRGSYPTHRL